MAAQLSTVAVSALPRPPTPEQFIAGLKAAAAPRERSPADQALFGDTFAKQPWPTGGTAKNRQVALRAVLDFEKVCTVRQAVFVNLDDWFVAFARWSVNVVCLFDSPEEQEAATAQRKALCASANVTPRSWVPSTLVTMTNALAALYKEGTDPVGAVVPSVVAHFPQYCAFFNAASLREKRLQAQKEEVPLLNDDEVEQLYDRTNWNNFLESQRMNLLVIAYNLGQRPETFMGLTAGCFHPKETDNGTEVLVKYPKQKAFQANQQNAKKELRDQLLLPRDNPKLCGVEAWRRQTKMLQH